MIHAPSRHTGIMRPGLLDGIRKTYGENEGDLTRVRDRLDQCVPDGCGGGFAPVCRSELGQEIGNMRGHGAVADIQLLGNLRVGSPLTEQGQDLPLAAGQRKRVSDVWSRCRIGWRPLHAQDAFCRDTVGNGLSDGQCASRGPCYRERCPAQPHTDARNVSLVHDGLAWKETNATCRPQRRYCAEQARSHFGITSVPNDGSQSLEALYCSELQPLVLFPRSVVGIASFLFAPELEALAVAGNRSALIACRAGALTQRSERLGDPNLVI